MPETGYLQTDVLAYRWLDRVDIQTGAVTARTDGNQGQPLPFVGRRLRIGRHRTTAMVASVDRDRIEIITWNS